MSGSVMALIRTTYKMLSPPQKRVADYVLNNPNKVILLSIAALATECNVSEPTVFRFLHKLSYHSYQVFRVNVAKESASDISQSLYADVFANDTSRQIVDKVIFSTKRALDDFESILNVENLERICQGIFSAKNAFIIGVGSTYAVAYDFYHKLSKLGICAFCSSDPHMININSGNMGKDESVLIAISHSGESREILDGADLAKQNGCPVFGITSFQNSSLAKAADAFLLSSSLETNYRSDALTSRILQFCIIDMVYIRLALLGGKEFMDKISASRLAVARNKT
jgi:DNA-binding MurR/RpiR family transcriptional regulator